MTGFVAKVEVDIAARPERVWKAMTDPDLVAEYMMGARVESDWQRGSPIVWRGEWDGKPFEDKGEVIAIDEPRMLTVTHFSPLTGKDDAPENYHTITYDLNERSGGTHLSLIQDNNASEDEAAHSSESWTQMLEGLKAAAERE